jgi:hypothetical protein
LFKAFELYTILTPQSCDGERKTNEMSVDLLVAVLMVIDMAMVFDDRFDSDCFDNPGVRRYKYQVCMQSWLSFA